MNDVAAVALTPPRFQFTIGDIFFALVSLAFPVAFAANLDRELYPASDLNVLWVLILATGLPGFLFALRFRRNWQSRSPWFVPPFLLCGWSLLLLFYASEVPRPLITGLSFYPALCLGFALAAYSRRTLAPDWYLVGVCALAPLLAISYTINVQAQETYFAKRETMAASTCRTLVQAQEIFHRLDHDNDGRLEYSQNLRGLYETKPGAADLNLISAALVRADSTEPSPVPYRGYFYRILHAQGDLAPGKAKSWMDSKGNLSLAHGAVAYPAEYGKTGIRTFVISSTGTIYQKDYGPDTPKIVKDMVFNPEPFWVCE